MQKGITPVVAVILLLLITISIVGFAMIFFQRIAAQSGAEAETQLGQTLATTAESFEIVNVNSNKVYVKNTGTGDLKNLKFYVDGNEVSAAAVSIPPNTIGEVPLNSAQLAAVPGDKLRVTSVGYTQEQPADFYDKSTVAYWKFDDTDGRTIKDASGNGNDGTFNGESWNDGTINGAVQTDGKYGKAMSFDGVDDNIATGSMGIPQNGQATIEGWFYFKDRAKDRGSTMYLYQDFMYHHSSNNFFYIAGTNDYFNWVPELNTWYHLGLTYSGDTSTAKLYVNGERHTINQQSGPHNILSFPGTIGANINAFNGIIDEVRIYSRALSATEVAEDMNSPYPIDRALASYSFEKIDSLYAVGDTLVHSDDTETAIVDDVNNGYKLMKTFQAPKSGSVRIKFSAKISSGLKYWGWKIAKNGGTVLKQTSGADAIGAYFNNLDTGETDSVHAYKRFKVDVQGLVPGDLLELWMCSTDGGAACGPTAGQTLFAKDFRIYADNLNKALDTHNVVRGKYGAALSFDGVDDYIDTGKTIFPTGGGALDAFTVSLWIRPKTIGTKVLVAQAASTERNGDVVLYVRSGNTIAIDRFTANNNADRGETASGILSPDIPVHVTATWAGGNDGTRTIYVNGYPQTITSSNNINTGDWNIPNTLISGNFPGYFSDSVIDEVRILNAAIS